MSSDDREDFEQNQLAQDRETGAVCQACAFEAGL